MSIIRNIFLLSTCAALASCEGVTTHEFTVRNSTSELLRFEVKSFSSENVDSIMPGSSKDVAYIELRGGSKNPLEVATQFEKFIFINTSNDTLTMDDVSDKWTIESDHVSKVPSHYDHDYKLNLTITDFTE